MDLYFLTVPGTLSGLSAMEKDLAELVGLFNTCAFDRGSLDKLVEYLKNEQGKLQKEHPRRSVCQIQISGTYGKSLNIRIGRYFVLCTKIPFVYTMG